MTMSDNTLVSEYGMCEEEQIARIAWFYYHDGLTQGEISKRLGLTRLKASRLLEKGHQFGIIRIHTNSRFEGCLEYENTLRSHFLFAEYSSFASITRCQHRSALRNCAAHSDVTELIGHLPVVKEVTADALLPQALAWISGHRWRKREKT